MKRLPLVLLLLACLAPSLRAIPAGLSGIPFVTSQAQFAVGDSISIQEVLASSPSLAPGDTVVVRGSYTLQSQSAASLGLSLTTSGPGGFTPVAPNSRMSIRAGTGTFELEYPIQQAGALHVTFFPATSGSSFGGIYFAAAGGSSGPASPGGPGTPPPPTSTSGLVNIPVVTSRAQYQAGDSITIEQVFASSPRMEPGDTVLVRGTFTLGSRDKAILMVSLTANAPGASERVAPASRRDISNGEGAFELEYTIQQPGSLHVSFYPAAGGSSFGGVYFPAPGTGGSSPSGGPALITPVSNTGLLGNLSIRSLVSPGAGTLVAGVTVADHERYVLIRGVGPSLSKFGVAGVLARPQLSVYNASGELIASTGSWSTAFNATQRAGIELLASSVGAFPLAAGSDDAVLHLRLVPGGYTIMVASGDGQSGVALIEVYASSTFALPAAP